MKTLFLYQLLYLPVSTSGVFRIQNKKRELLDDTKAKSNKNCGMPKHQSPTKQQAPSTKHQAAIIY